MVRSYRLTGVPDAVLQVRSDRQKFQPYGLQGGHNGAFAANYLTGESGERVQLPGKFMRTFQRGELYEAILAGGGGWGDPLERDAQLVLEDVIDGKVTAAAAASEYGVLVTQSGAGVDLAATHLARARIRANRTKATGKEAS